MPALLLGGERKMSFALPLNEMTITEKLLMMEQLWEDLCRDPEAVPSPAWHAPILSAREAQVQQGTESILDWQEAKKRLRDELS